MDRNPFAPERERVQQLLRQLRQEAGLKQIELATRLGKPQSFVSRYESGERHLDLPELRVICHALNTPLAEFVRRFEDGLES